MWYIVLAILGTMLFLLIAAFSSHSSFISTFERYDLVKNQAGIKAEDVLQLLIREKRIKIKLGVVSGKFLDCYMPKKKMIALSDSTYQNNSVSAVAIVAHELGHALQHKEKSFLFVFSRFIGVIYSVISKVLLLSFLVGIIFLLFNSLQHIGLIILWSCVGVIALYILFKIISIPLEFNASKRAMILLSEYKILNEKELKMARKVLDRAAGTYIADFITLILGINFLKRRKR